MRVITGSARGCRLETLPGEDTRPTTERVKEGLFSAIHFDVEGRRVLDLFAGSGQLGIEALSRGASGCIFVDQNQAAIPIIRGNLQKAGLSAKAQVICREAMNYLVRPGETFDLVFLDPPYASGLLIRALMAVEPLMNPGGVIVCESDEGMEMPERVGAFALKKTYHYGRIHLWLYRFTD